jgi:predicted SnoaL-like aldol condensation-catalyzing enzyme
MKFHTIISTLFAALLTFGSNAQAQTTPNEKLVVKAMTELFAKRDVATIEKYWGSTYIQHNPTIANGHDGVKGLIQSIPPSFKYESGMVASSGDIVMLHGRFSGMGPKAIIVVDIFRVKDGKFVEHWDVLQDEVPAAQTKSGNPMFVPLR